MLDSFSNKKEHFCLNECLELPESIAVKEVDMSQKCYVYLNRFSYICSFNDMIPLFLLHCKTLPDF